MEKQQLKALLKGEILTLIAAIGGMGNAFYIWLDQSQHVIIGTLSTAILCQGLFLYLFIIQLKSKGYDVQTRQLIGKLTPWLFGINLPIWSLYIFLINTYHGTLIGDRMINILFIVTISGVIVLNNLLRRNKVA